MSVPSSRKLRERQQEEEHHEEMSESPKKEEEEEGHHWWSRFDATKLTTIFDWPQYHQSETHHESEGSQASKQAARDDDSEASKQSLFKELAWGW